MLLVTFPSLSRARGAVVLRGSTNFILADLCNVELLNNRYLRFTVSVDFLVNIILFSAVLSMLNLDRPVTAWLSRLILKALVDYSRSDTGDSLWVYFYKGVKPRLTLYVGELFVIIQFLGHPVPA